MTTEVGGTLAHYRRMFRHTAAYAVGNLATRLVGFLLVPVISRRVPQTEIGAWEVVVATAGFLVTVLGLGMGTALFRHYFRAEDDRERDRVVGTAFVFLGLVSLGTLGAVWLARAPVSELITGDVSYARLLEIALIGVFFDVGLMVPFALMRAREQSLHFAAIGTARLLINLSLSLWFLVGLGLGAYGILLGNAVTSAMFYLFFLPMLVKRVAAGFDRDALRAMLAFGLPVMGAIIGGVLLDRSDRWLLSRLRGLEEVGIYGIVYRIPQAVSVGFVQPFILAWPAIVWSLEKKPEGPRVYSRALTYAGLVACFLALGVSLFRGELISVWVGEKYVEAGWIVPWIVYGYAVNVCYYVLVTGVSLAGQTRYLPVAVGVAVVINVALNLIVIPPYGMRGAAVATLVSYLVMAFIIGFFSQRARPFPYEWRRVAWIGFAAVVWTVIGLQAEGVPGWPGVGLRLLAWLGFVASIANPIFLDVRERETLRRFVRNRLGKGDPPRPSTTTSSGRGSSDDGPGS